MKNCSKCKQAKDISEFRKAPGTPYCKVCINAYMQDWYKRRSLETIMTTKAARKKYWDLHKNSITLSIKNNRLKRRYGITLQEREVMKERQQNKCLICRKTFTNSTMNIDHNHETGEIRGLLCYACNSVLGYSYENIETLKRTILYLTSPKECVI